MPPKQNLPSDKAAPEPREVTRLESDEEIRQALQARRPRQTVRARMEATDTKAQAAAAEAEVQPEQPVERPPVALLCVLDDDKRDGEWLRLRTDRTVIGRTEGDIRIPHDGLISGRHAEIVRQPGQNAYRWLLADLQSTNGSFVRVSGSGLRDKYELLIGTGRYRFEAIVAPGQATPASKPGSPKPSTRAWLDEPPSALVPSLVEITPAGPVQRFPLALPEYWIGRDPQSCRLARPANVLVNPRHARLYRDENGQWHIENNHSLNGLWLRVLDPIPLGHACRFRLGEQQFLFRVK